jgi:hypothetical protein
MPDISSIISTIFQIPLKYLKETKAIIRANKPRITVKIIIGDIMLMLFILYLLLSSYINIFLLLVGRGYSLSLSLSLSLSCYEKPVSKSRNFLKF